MTYLRVFVALACVALLVPAVAADNDTRAPVAAASGAAASGAAAASNAAAASEAAAAGAAGFAAAGNPVAALAASPSCASRVAAALDGVARDVYAQAASGRAPAAASARLTRSPALTAALARDDPRAARTALTPLLRGQIKRIVIVRDGRTLVALGHGAALAPVTGSIAGATYTLSVASASGIESIVHELTGERVALEPGSGDVPVTEYPAGAAHLTLSGHPPCESVIASVGLRLLHGELAGPHTRHVLHLVGTDPRFAHAVATDNPAALRAQIVRFFQDPRLHVVRIRATRHGRLVNDVGGPDVLAPASGPVTLHGRVVGRVTLSIQDDAGYVKLLHRFTGATVALTGTGPHLTLPRFPTGTLDVFARGPKTL